MPGRGAPESHRSRCAGAVPQPPPSGARMTPLSRREPMLEAFTRFTKARALYRRDGLGAVAYRAAFLGVQKIGCHLEWFDLYETTAGDHEGDGTLAWAWIEGTPEQIRQLCGLVRTRSSIATASIRVSVCGHPRRAGTTPDHRDALVRRLRLLGRGRRQHSARDDRHLGRRWRRRSRPARPAAAFAPVPGGAPPPDGGRGRHAGAVLCGRGQCLLAALGRATWGPDARPDLHAACRTLGAGPQPSGAALRTRADHVARATTTSAPRVRSTRPSNG